MAALQRIQIKVQELPSSLHQCAIVVVVAAVTYYYLFASFSIAKARNRKSQAKWERKQHPQGNVRFGEFNARAWEALRH